MRSTLPSLRPGASCTGLTSLSKVRSTAHTATAARISPPAKYIVPGMPVLGVHTDSSSPVVAIATRSYTGAQPCTRYSPTSSRIAAAVTYVYIRLRSLASVVLGPGTPDSSQSSTRTEVRTEDEYRYTGRCRTAIIVNMYTRYTHDVYRFC